MWVVKAYGLTFTARSAEKAMNAADAYGEKRQLRAVSMFANWISK